MTNNYGAAEEIVSRDLVDAKHESWYQKRREGITATDIGPLTGNSMYQKTPFTVYWTKVADLRTEPTKQMQTGTEWQEFITGAAYTRGGNLYEGTWEDIAAPGLLQNTVRPWMLASPDALVYVKDIGWVPLEIKTTAIYKKDGVRLFGTPGTDEVPQDYFCQVAWQAMVVGADFGYLAVLFPNHQVEIYEIKRNLDWDWMAGEAETFYREFLLPENPPMVVGTGAELLVMKKIQELSPDSTLEWDDELINLVAEIRHHRATIRDYKKLADRAEVRIREKMGNAKTLTDRDGKPVLVRNVVKRKGFSVNPTEFETILLKGEKSEES